MRTLNRSLAWLAISFIASGVRAEQLYVSDKLVLNVYAEPGQGGNRIATIETGDVVEGLERVDTFVRVRLADGREGWVGASYLNAQPPAIVRLKELQAGQAPSPAPSKEAKDDMARLQKQNAALTAEVAELKKKAATATAPATAAIKDDPPPTPAVNAASEEPVEIESVIVTERSYWWAWMIVVIAAAGGGFFAGYQTLARRVRERFGGVKVY